MEKLEKSPEAVEIFDLSKLTIGQAVMLSDGLFKDVNVNNVTFTLTDESEHIALADFLSRMKKHCLLYVIQESSPYHMKVTFVHKTPYGVFCKLADRQIDLACKANNYCPIRSDSFKGVSKHIR